MDLLTGAMGILGPKLLDLLQHEYNLQTDLSNEVRSLSLEMEHIDAFLRQVADVPWDQLNEHVKIWAREVREASYNMEDALDIFLVHVEHREPDDQSMLKRALKMIRDLFIKGKPRRDVAVLIEDIKKQLKEVAERRARYKIDDSLAKPPAAASSTIDPRLSAMYHEVDKLVGIDKSRDEVESMLSYQCGNGVLYDKLRKVSVVGVGGLGKTTLAKAVYEKLKGDFDCGAFVPVGRNPDLKRVFKDILLDLDKGNYTRNLDMSILDERHLIDEIREHLKEKRYLIVIDDIWELQSWGIIEYALVENICGSRVITTTRNLEVAEEAGKVYKLGSLSDDHSKKLFYTRIFGGEEKCLGVQSDEVSEKILKKCGGIPLAIITMASLLVGKPREVWCELYSYIGFVPKDNLHVENTKTILSFSYYDLPSHLRTCLLYLSAYPEDYVIGKGPLIWMWIAEGFVQKKQGSGLFELGEQYFNDLINRSMIQPLKSNDGTVEGCYVHDMVLDLIRSLSCHENSVTILDNIEGTLSQHKVRRLACQKYDSEHIPPQAGHMDMSRVRSYIACMCRVNQWAPLWSFKLLRVLAMEHCDLKEDSHFEILEDLLHLRYLSLRHTNVSRLPKQIGNLKFLQTLDIGGTKIEELPESIVQLTQLLCLSCGGDDHVLQERNFYKMVVNMFLGSQDGDSIVPESRSRNDAFHPIYFDYCGGRGWRSIRRVPDGIGNLTSLEHLTICAGDGYNDEYKNNVRMFVKELGSLRELRMLKIIFFFLDESVQRYLAESLRNLHKIHHITVTKGSNLYADADIAMWETTGFVLPQHLSHLSLKGFRFSRLPSWINPSRLHHLTFLELHVVTMDEQDLKLLGSLTELRYLDLCEMKATATVSKVNASDGFFQKLRWFVMRCVMVQFQCEEESTFSFHIWDGICPMPFGASTRRKNSCCVPSAVMPNLEVLKMHVFASALKDGNGDYTDIGLKYLTSLRKLEAFMNPCRAFATKVDEVVANLRCAINDHPNSPILVMHGLDPGEESETGGLPTKEEKENHDKDEDDEDMEEEEENDDYDKDMKDMENADKEEQDTATSKRRRLSTRSRGLRPQAN